MAKLKLKSKERVSKNPYFRYVEEEAVKLKQRQDASIYALDLKGYQAQQAAAKDPDDKAKEFSKNITGFNAASVTANIQINKANPAKEEVEKGFIQRITKDYYLEEAMYILSEMWFQFPFITYILHAFEKYGKKLVTFWRSGSIQAKYLEAWQMKKFWSLLSLEMKKR